MSTPELSMIMNHNHPLEESRNNLDQLLDEWEMFVGDWLTDALQDVGINMEGLESLGVPAPLLRAYFIGLDQIEDAQDILLPSNQLQKDGERLIFAVENQCVWEAAVIPTEPNPNVWMGISQEEWFVTGTSLAEFLVTLSLQECMFASAESAAETGLRNRLFHRDPSAMRVLWSAGEMFHGARSFWLFAESVLMMEFEGGQSTYYGCRTSKDYEKYIVEG